MSGRTSEGPGECRSDGSQEHKMTCLSDGRSGQNVDGWTGELSE